MSDLIDSSDETGHLGVNGPREKTTSESTIGIRRDRLGIKVGQDSA